jgi:hypothetical protein
MIQCRHGLNGSDGDLVPEGLPSFGGGGGGAASGVGEELCSEVARVANLGATSRIPRGPPRSDHLPCRTLSPRWVEEHGYNCHL